MADTQYLARSRAFLNELWESGRQGFEKRFPETYAHLPYYWQLTRMDRPIGIFLLLWPTLWCLWIAAEGIPDLKLLIIFTLGTVLMRAAGCCINDYADRDFDGHVERTKNRPLAKGRITGKEALILCALLCLLAFCLVLLTNRLTVYMSFGGWGWHCSTRSPSASPTWPSFFRCGFFLGRGNGIYRANWQASGFTRGCSIRPTSSGPWFMTRSTPW